MNKLSSIFFSTFFIVNVISAQNIGIGTAFPDVSSLLEIRSTTKGILIPRVTTAQLNAISSPAKGLMVLDTSTNQLMINRGTSLVPDWQSVVIGSGWALKGNSGTDPANDFVGTLDTQPLIFGVNNILSGRIDTNWNVALGMGAFNYVTSGKGNSAFGQTALWKNTTGNYNTATGRGALSQNISGNNNTSVGKFSLYNNLRGNDNVAIGNGVLFNDTMPNNIVAIGDSALYFQKYFPGFDGGNIAIGSKALFTNLYGSSNSALGRLSLYNNSSGSGNSVLGDKAMLFNISGSGNVAIGNKSLTAHIRGDGNIAVGQEALADDTIGVQNVAIGLNALRLNKQSNHSVAVGDGALYNFNGSNTGGANTAIGKLSQINNVSGNFNTTIGSYSDVGAILLSNSTAVGSFSRVDCSNCMVLGAVNGINGATSDVNVGIGTSNPVHARLEINGSLGDAVAIFGANRFGTTIKADYPGIGLNYYYNNGAKTIKAGYAGLLEMNTTNGTINIGGFGGNQSAADFSNITGYQQIMTLQQNGNVGIGTTTPGATLDVQKTGSNNTLVNFKGTTHYSHFMFGVNEDTYIRAGKDNSSVILNDIPGGRIGMGMSNPTRASVEQNGSVGATAAIFGGDGNGISLQKNWPAIGFNSYLDGAGHKSINSGFGAQLGLSQLNGSLYLVSFPFNVQPNQLFPSFTQRFYISRFGRLGINDDDPLADITIKSFRSQQDANPDNFGLRLNLVDDVQGSFGGAWNILSEGIRLTFRRQSVNLASILGDGSYNQLSDERAKNNIRNFENNSLEKILNLRPVNYFLNTDETHSKRSVGFIAQEAAKIFPEAVNIFQNGDMGISYSNFIPLLTKGIQEQQQQIEILQKENADLKARLERLEKYIYK